MGFVGSKRETKHHLWNCNLIDCCSHYPVEFLKLLRAWAWERVRDTQRGRGGGKPGRKGSTDMELAELSSAKPLKSSATQQLHRALQAESRERKRTQRSSPEETLTPVFPPCSLYTKIQLKPPLCLVLKLDYEVANAFSSADKKVRLFISGESLWGFRPLLSPPHHSEAQRRWLVRWETLIRNERHNSHLRWRVFYSCPLQFQKKNPFPCSSEPQADRAFVLTMVWIIINKNDSFVPIVLFLSSSSYVLAKKT